MTEYFIPAGAGESEYVEKRSRFLGRVRPVESEEEARAFIAEMTMLEVFRREGVTNLVCVVTRYFGGVLLGAGGLFRAYTKAAKDALDAAGVAVVRRWVETELRCSYSAAERLKLEASAFDGVVTDVEYAASVTIRALVPEEKAEAFAARVFDLSAGAVEVKAVGESFRAVRVR